MECSRAARVSASPQIASTGSPEATGGTDTSTTSACAMAERRSAEAMTPSKASAVIPGRTYKFRRAARVASRTVAQTRSKRSP